LYSASDEVEKLRATSDCLTLFRSVVTQKNLLTAADLDAVDSDVAELIEKSVASAKAAPYPTQADLQTHVYVRY
jgi:pyruvate dehydrogenase E1 component alpha subunit